MVILDSARFTIYPFEILVRDIDHSSNTERYGTVQDLNKQTQKSQLIEFIFHAGIFVFMLVWFTVIHPVVVFDGDDWTYIGMIREGLPVWGSWNPARVFPEVAMSLWSCAAVHTLFPLTGDYLLSFTISSGLLISFFIVVYVHCFSRMIRRIFHFDHASIHRYTPVCISFLFVILHFLIFRISNRNNNYLLRCDNLTCYYYYLIPSLMNACFVMYMIKNPDFDGLISGHEPHRLGIALCIVYLCIFSNLPSSGILAAFAGAKFLFGTIKAFQKRFSLTDYLKTNYFYVLILVMWLISAIFELSGGRAASFSSSQRNLLGDLKHTIVLWFSVPKGCSETFIHASAIIMTVLLLLLIWRRKKDVLSFVSHLAFIAFCTVVVAIYTTILCAAISPDYLLSSTYLFAFFFYVFIFLMCALSFILKECPKLLVIMPLTLFILLTKINTQGNTFLESTVNNVKGKTCYEMGNDYLQQIEEANQKGLTSMTLNVPIWGKESNWPHSAFLGERMTNTLYEHGLIDREMIITVLPNEEWNMKYNLPLPE